MVIYEIKDKDWFSKTEMNSCILPNGSIILFGGIRNSIKQSSCFIFDKNENISFITSKLARPSRFIPQIEPLLYNSKVYSICEDKLLHCLDFYTKTWSIIDYYKFTNLN